MYTFESFIDVILFIAHFAMGFAVVYLCGLLINKVPAKWLCDYDETPSKELMGKRIYFNRSMVFLSVFTGLCLSLIYLAYHRNLVLMLLFTLAVVMLTPIFISDAKYGIIPDQFTIGFAVFALIFAIYDCFFGSHIFIQENDWYFSVLGAIVGGGILILLNIFGKLIFKKESIGFGDIKFFTAIGLFVGLQNIGLIFLLTIFIALFHIIIARPKMDRYLPFGPYICIGTVLFITFYFPIIKLVILYLNLIKI